MGEVYRARDERIGRDVAVKVLPAAVAHDAERLRRFEQEAQAAGRLNHPNVLTVHDVGQHEGVPFVVSELLEGETLRARLGGSSLPVRKATEIASQIARGLGAAHEGGIVHRDLKPENVFVAKDGQVKILDFGLAKLTRGDSPFAPESDVATEAPGTDPGTVLGTVGYMSPEQVRGRPVDHRSDIFSLGAILYEMLSGQRAFARESSVETLNAILKEDPPELAASGRALPPTLDRIVRHCLEKNPDERFASARDLAFDLQALCDVSAPVSALPARPAAARRLVAAAAGLALLGAGLAVGIRLGGRKAAPPPQYRQLTFRRGFVAHAVFSPDGQSIYYSAAWEGEPVQVFAIDAGTGESRAMGSEGWVAGVLQGELAVWLRDGTVIKVPRAGGAPRALLSDVADAFVAPDGATLGVIRSSGGRQRLELPPGQVLLETPDAISRPRLSPDGEHLALAKGPPGGFADGRVVVVDRHGRQRVATQEWNDLSCGLAWAADGREVWYAASPEGSMDCELRAIALDGGDRMVARMPGSLQLLDITRDGRVLLGHQRRRFETRGRLPGETDERDLSWFDRTYLEDLTPDGRAMIFHESGRGGGPRESAFLRPVDGSPAVRLGDGMALAVSPDARWVVASATAADEGIRRLAVVPTGAGEPRPLPLGAIETYSDAWWLPDGRRLLLDASESSGGRRLFVQGLAGGEPEPVTEAGVSAVPNTRPISPDGTWVVARRLEPGAPFELYPVAGGEPRRVAGLQPGETPLGWSGDGRSLFVRLAEAGRSPAQLVRLDLASGRREPWLTLAPPDAAGVPRISDIVLSGDGRGYVYTYARNLGDLYLVEGLR